MSRPGPDVIYTCKRCGDKYHPTSSRQQCCNKPIKVSCAVCGKLMDQICTLARQNETCSKECNNKLIKQRQIESGKKNTKICEWCGKEFHPKYIRELYCEGPHYQTCKLCGKEFEIDLHKWKDRITCSEECRYILANKDKDIEQMKANLKSTMLRKYGVENAMDLRSSKDKMKSTLQRKYGGAYTATKEYKDKVRKTCLNKYGTEHHLQSEIVKEKRKATVQQKYGVDNTFQSEQLKEKGRRTMLEKYGVEYPMQSPKFHEEAFFDRKNNIAPDGKTFDSSYELQFYNFLLSLAYQDLVNTQVPIHFEYKHRSHVVLIDFKVDNIFIEVKGSHLLNGVFNYKQVIPINIKLDVYKRNNVLIITDTFYDIKEVFKDNLIGLHIDMFKNVNEPKLLWKKIIKLYQNKQYGFYDNLDHI